MATPKEDLKALVQDMIADRTESAEAHFSSYITAKTQQMAGLSPQPVADETHTE